MEVAREVEPQLLKLTEKAVDIITDLEEEERKMMEQVRLESDKQKHRVQRQKTVRSGLSNIKRLQSLTRRKNELSRSAAELDEVLEQKKYEFGLLVDKANSDESRASQLGSIKRMRRHPNHVSHLTDTLEKLAGNLKPLVVHSD